jgi:hypothetical protein
LPGVKDEIFAKDRDLNRFARVAEVFECAAEEFSFGEDRERDGACGFERRGKRDGIERIADDAARG